MFSKKPNEQILVPHTYDTGKYLERSKDVVWFRSFQMNNPQTFAEIFDTDKNPFGYIAEVRGNKVRRVRKHLDKLVQH
jgi:hypothetical protein